MMMLIPVEKEEMEEMLAVLTGSRRSVETVTQMTFLYTERFPTHTPQGLPSLTGLNTTELVATYKGCLRDSAQFLSFERLLLSPFSS